MNEVDASAGCINLVFILDFSLRGNKSVPLDRGKGSFEAKEAQTHGINNLHVVKFLNDDGCASGSASHVNTSLYSIFKK